MNEEQPNSFVVTKAQRRAVPMLISLAGTSGSGKTFSGLLMAGGIAGSDGRVGMIDAENGRGTLYADDPLIMKAIPKGYLYTPISTPYSPSRYVEALKALESAGCTIAVIDSASHEWEGDGGCSDIAEAKKIKNNPNWIVAKREHRRFMSHALTSPMHIIFCLRAREKVRVIRAAKGEQLTYEPLGIQPIAEKNFVFEMLLSLMFNGTEGSPLHHTYVGMKVPKMMAEAFPGNELITVRHGEAIRRWADGGAMVAPSELLSRRARAVAADGVEAYRTFFTGLTSAQRKELEAEHPTLKDIAQRVDDDRAVLDAKEPTEPTPEEMAEFDRREAEAAIRAKGAA